ncbi:MAG: sensor hybrid histidine kinase [Myxococcales bacterium]|nr:sensor hybrid histidine kinase [Myxococcales bacterium]
MGRALRLLVVEDHEDTADLLAELLGARGHTVRTAYTAHAALELSAHHTFDIVLSDVGLPDSTGYELMEKLHALYAMKGIALTGWSGELDVERGKAAGFSAHLTKPVSMSRLESTLEQLS